MNRRRIVATALMGSLVAVSFGWSARAHAAPANDDCASATVIAAVPFSDDVDTTSATLSGSDPQLCDGAGPGTHSVWYSFTPAQSGQMRIETLASDYDTVVGVFGGTCAAPVPNSCNDDFPDARTSGLIFAVSAGTPVLIDVAGFPATSRPPDSGHLHFSLDFLPDKAVAKSVSKCQQTIKKSAGALVVKGLGVADKCVNGLLKCVETGAADPNCIPKQCVKCEKALAQATMLAQKFTEATLKSCQAVPIAQMMQTTGIGYDLVASQCAGGLTSINDIATCVGNQHACQLGRLFAAQEPRARELVALCPNLPQNAATNCFPDHGSGGAIADAPTAKAVLKCESAVKKAATKFVSAKLKGLQKCVDVTFSCIETKPGDQKCLDGAEQQGGKVGGSDLACDKLFAKIAAAETKLGPAIDKACAGIQPFSLLAGASGANIVALATECAALSVPDISTLPNYELCLFRQHECLVDDLLRFEAPRAEGLLQLDEPTPELDDSFCPNPLRTTS